MPYFEPQGYGENVIGGLEGSIYRVENLNDGGVRSLREGIEKIGARRIKFEVSGTIELESPLTILNASLTVEGDSAPRGGICLKNEGIRIQSSEVIIRHLRIRPGPDALDPGNNDCITVQNSKALIANCSLSWATDEIITCSGASDITIQYCIISEGILPTYFGAFMTFFSDRISFHHNLIAHINDRMPTIKGGKIDVRNNVVYNAKNLLQINPMTSPALVNIVGNNYIPGPDTTASAYINPEPGAAFEAESEIYLEGNRDQNRTNDEQPENACVTSGRENSVMFVPNEISMPFTITTDAPQALKDVIAFAGAILPTRDDVDHRIISDLQNLTGSIIDDPAEVGGWPDLTEFNSAPTNRTSKPWVFEVFKPKQNSEN